MCEEMRWLEYGQRLVREQRGALADPDGTVAGPLFRAATLNGGRALGVDVGRIAPGAWGDFFTLDLAAPALAGTDDRTLLEAFVFGAGSSAVRATCVAGRWRDGPAARTQ